MENLKSDVSVFRDLSPSGVPGGPEHRALSPLREGMEA